MGIPQECFSNTPRLPPTFPCAHRIADSSKSNLTRKASVTPPATFEDVKAFCMETNSHRVIEVHMPTIVPLSYIERIVIPSVGCLEEMWLGD